MTQTPQPYRPPSDSEIPARYRRPRRQVSWIGAIIGLVLGIGGGLFFAWYVSPIPEFDNEPWQLTADAKADFVVAIMLRYSQDGDVGRAVQSLIDLRLSGDPIQTVADMACSLASTGYANNVSGVRAIRAMMSFYQPQGRTGCADSLIPADNVAATDVIEITVPTNTPTLAPPATKTPTPLRPAGGSPTPALVIVPTSAPQSDFIYVNATTFCDANASGMIEVYVYAVNGATGIPGQAIRVRWDGGESIFFTGLKPERGAAYADFQMEADRSYIVDMPGRADPLPQPLVAVPCTTPEGGRAVISYRVTFREA